jgi:hypothetical protein
MNEYNIISMDMYGHSFCLIMKIRIKIGNINNNMNILSLHSFYIYWIYYYGNLNTIN